MYLLLKKYIELTFSDDNDSSLVSKVKFLLTLYQLKRDMDDHIEDICIRRIVGYIETTSTFKHKHDLYISLYYVIKTLDENILGYCTTVECIKNSIIDNYILDNMRTIDEGEEAGEMIIICKEPEEDDEKNPELN